MSIKRVLAAAAVAVAIVLVTPRSLSAPEPTALAEGWQVSGSPWRTDRVWYDGKAEMCVYDATQVIYGAPRSYRARAYTNKQRMDPRTTTKSATERGVLMFKHHWSERVSTESYDYDYSTAVFLEADTLAAAKITAATQEDCGASFKQGWRVGDKLKWLDSVYFPDAGLRQDTLKRADGLVFADDLFLRLRDYPFDAPRDVELRVLPSQRTTRQASWAPRTRTLRYRGQERLDLPVGAVDAHHLTLLDLEGQAVADYWFATDGGAPVLHALVQYQDPERTYRLRSHERTAYWDR